MEKVSLARMLLNNILANSNLWEEFDNESLFLLINNVNNHLFKITPITSYSSQVFLLSFEKNTQKFVIKIRAISTEMKLRTEVQVFKILSKEITIPKLVLYGTYCDYEISIYDYIDTLKNNHGNILNKDQIHLIWKSILIIQNALFRSRDSLNLHVLSNKNYAHEVYRYTLKYVNKEIPINYLEVLSNQLSSSLFEKSVTVFSDRSRTNWIISKNNIIPIDFDLLLLEPVLADFIQFIDHHELRTSYSRDNLISSCLSFLVTNDIYFTKEDFHWHAVYRNLTQGAIFYKVNKNISLFHYKKAIASLNALNDKLLNKQIKKILSEVAWI